MTTFITKTLGVLLGFAELAAKVILKSSDDIIFFPIFLILLIPLYIYFKTKKTSKAKQIIQFGLAYIIAYFLPIILLLFLTASQPFPI